jgi:hypothetical protein
MKNFVGFEVFIWVLSFIIINAYFYIRTKEVSKTAISIIVISGLCLIIHITYLFLFNPDSLVLNYLEKCKTIYK